jgi:hypothetical protein
MSLSSSSCQSSGIKLGSKIVSAVITNDLLRRYPPKKVSERVFKLTGIGIVKDDVTSLFLRSEDADKVFREIYRQKKTVKVKRMQNHFKKIREGVEKLKKDNARELSYGTGMMGPGADDENGDQNRAVAGSEKRVFCKHCKSNTHSRITSKHCAKNPKNQPQQQETSNLTQLCK